MATYCWTNFLANYVCQFHSIFIPLESDSLVRHLTSFMSFSAVPVWLCEHWYKSTPILNLYPVAKQWLSLEFWKFVTFKFLPQLDFERLGILLKKFVVFALEMKSPYLSNLSVVLFCSASVNIIIFLYNYNASNLTARTDCVSIFIINI